MSLPDVDVYADASLSPCGTYRYVLTRDWFPKDRGHVLWIMLNPSTADARTDDQTLRRCQDYTRRWGYDGVSVVNLFALRSRWPDVLRDHPDPVGPANDDVLATLFAAKGIGLAVAAWGTNGTWMRRDLDVVRLAKQAGRDLHALFLTRGGNPVHPSRQPTERTPIPYRPWEIYG